MANEPHEPRFNHRVQELDSPVSPSADYGLKNGDGFDPSKYDFYNPISRNARQAFIVRLDEQRVPSSPNGNHDSIPTDLYESETPPPLSPIEELDDELHIPGPESHSGPGLPASNLDDPPTVVDFGDDDAETDDAETEDAVHLSLTKRSELLFSRQHLQLILADPALSLKFTTFLRTYRPDSVPILAYYLDSTKALKTIKYAEAIITGLEPIPGHAFTSEANIATMAWVIEDKIDRALDVLAEQDMPAFIAYVYVKTVDLALVDRITGNKDPNMSSIADGLAEVFVLSDPARPDNPIVFSSEEFHRMTGYTRKEFLGRNCRTLGGPQTSQPGIIRFRKSLDAEREHCEVLLNYHRNGSPFINLIMCVPLRDQHGKVRYYLGAQLDITELVNNCTELSSFRQLVEQQTENAGKSPNQKETSGARQEDEFEQLSEAFNPQELDKLVKLRRRQHFEFNGAVSEEVTGERIVEKTPLGTPSSDPDNTFQLNVQGSAPPLSFYQNYLLVRPYPSLRILFASPDLRIPGILQSPLLSRIGGSARVRDDLAHALEVGRKVTAKVQWLSKSLPKQKTKWIHCTPLLGVNDTVGVWMVILVDVDETRDLDAEQSALESRPVLRPVPVPVAQAIPWEAARQDDNQSGFFANIWSGNDDNRRSVDDDVRPIPRHPRFGQPPEFVDSTPQRPGSNGRRTTGRQYSANEREDDYSFRRDDNRPVSHGSTIIPVSDQMRPTIKIAGRPSFDLESGRKLPINMPGQMSGMDEDGKLPTRRTYKSLSPYGILFED